jgi:hypothetical protein
MAAAMLFTGHGLHNPQLLAWIAARDVASHLSF